MGPEGGLEPKPGIGSGTRFGGIPAVRSAVCTEAGSGAVGRAEWVHQKKDNTSSATAAIRR